MQPLVFFCSWPCWSAFLFNVAFSLLFVLVMVCMELSAIGDDELSLFLDDINVFSLPE
jgi:hypothetical protein